MERWWSASRQLSYFWLCLAVGITLGANISLPSLITLWLTSLWVLIYLSGQSPKIELLAITCIGLGSGYLLWHYTSGESWLHPEALNYIAEKLALLRDALIDRIFTALPEPHGSLLAGILLGNRIKLDAELIEVFRIAGLSHLIAVSGYNLTVLTANIDSATRPLIGKNSAWLGLVAILLFVIITGASPSILRAGVMTSILLIGRLVGRPSQSLIALITASGVLAIFQPKIIFELGFQLSILATFGLIRLAPMIKHALTKVRLPETLRQIISETTAATIMTAPLLVLAFERLSAVSPITNLLVLPVIPFLMGIGIVSATALLVLPAVGSIIALLCWPILEWIVQVANISSRWQYATADISLPWWIGATLLAVLVVGSSILHQRFKLAEVKINRIY